MNPARRIAELLDRVAMSTSITRSRAADVERHDRHGNGSRVAGEVGRLSELERRVDKIEKAIA